MDANHRRRLLAFTLLVEALIPARRAERSRWTSPYLERRVEHGCYNNLLQEFAREDTEQYRRFLRMTEENFHCLMSFIRPRITKKDTWMRRAIPAEEKLAVVLRLLASGETMHSLHCQFRISTETISRFFPQVCEAIYQVLRQRKYIKLPTTTVEWLQIAVEGEAKWNFPNFIGAVDGKHVEIVPPPDAGSHFFNYKGFHSIVLMALVDANYRFIHVDVGTNGRISDGGVWSNTLLHSLFEDEKNPLQIPQPRQIAGINTPIPYMIVGDDAFPLKTYLQKPFPYDSLSPQEKIFNYRLSRIRRVVENAFALLVKKWGIFIKSMDYNLETTKVAVLAACALHNFLITHSDSYRISAQNDVRIWDEQRQCTGRQTDEPPLSLTPLQISRSNRSRTIAQDIRSSLREYFFSQEGSVPWQWERAGVQCPH